MFRTIKVQLLGDMTSLIDTALRYTQACQLALDYGFKNKTNSKNKINTGTYNAVRERMQQLPSGLVQCARDQACEMLKREKCKTLSTKKRLQIRYDKRTFKFYPESNSVSLSTVDGRQKYRVYIPEYFRYLLNGIYTNAQLVIKRGKAFLNIQCETEGYSLNDDNRILGIDRGILNIVTCSDNTFVNSKHLRAVKSRYKHLKSKLQSIGTRSAKRKLQILAGRERRFVLDTNHCLSKMLVSKPYGIYVVEELHIQRKKSNGKKFNGKLGGWSYGQLTTFLEYKSEDTGKLVIAIDPKYTSQKCSRCGYIHKQNRKGHRFKCKRCSFELNADLNAARNIAQLGTSLLSRLPVNEPIVAHNGTVATSPQALAVGS
jgi:IS605 OrfB family transposase